MHLEPLEVCRSAARSRKSKVAVSSSRTFAPPHSNPISARRRLALQASFAAGTPNDGRREAEQPGSPPGQGGQDAAREGQESQGQLFCSLSQRTPQLLTTECVATGLHLGFFPSRREAGAQERREGPDEAACPRCRPHFQRYRRPGRQERRRRCSTRHCRCHGAVRGALRSILFPFEAGELTSGSAPFALQVGKTTLIRSLVRRYTKNTMVDIKGPVTIVSGQFATPRELSRGGNQ